PTTATHSLSLHDALPILHSRTVHALAAVTIAAGAAGCSKKEAEGGERAGTSSSTGEKDRAEPSQRSKLHPHRSLLDEVSRAEVRSEEHTSELQSRENLVC